MKAQANEKQEYLDIQLSWNGESELDDSGEPSNYLYETAGDIFSIHGGLNAEDKSLIGKFRHYYVDVVEATKSGVHVYDVLDTHGHTEIYYGAIFESDTCKFNQDLLNLLDDKVSGGNVLILDRLEILPMYRRRGLGLAIIRHMMTRFAAGAGVIAMNPFPLQFESADSDPDAMQWRASMQLGDLASTQEEVIKKLRSYYGRLGFRKIPRTPFMACSTS